MKFVKVLNDDFSTVLIPLADVKKFEVEGLNESFESLDKEGGLLFAKQIKIHTPYEVFTVTPAKLNRERYFFKEADKNFDEASETDFFEFLEKDSNLNAAKKAVFDEIEKIEREFEKFLESEEKVFDLAKIQDEFRKIKI